MKLEEICLNNTFSHIYVEKEAFEYEITKEIIGRYKNAKIVEINHYKDVFNRSRQNYVLQHVSQKLILAVQHGNSIFKGAPVCQNFGNDNFYYASVMRNCIFDCEYCYLKGMYPSGNMVLYVNLEDTFKEVEEILKEHPMYICVSYDTDLLAVEALTGYVKKWIDFVDEHENLTIEVRTKSGGLEHWDKLKASERVIFAFTMSPEEVVFKYEHGTASLESRIKSAAIAQEKGFSVRLCFDPMLYIRDWKRVYEKMIADVEEALDMDKIWDVSVGSFRVSQDYLKKMRKNEPCSTIVQFPYQNTDGYYHYPDELLQEMEGFLDSCLSKIVPEEKIFRW